MSLIMEPPSSNIFETFLNADAFATPTLPSTGFDFDGSKDLFAESFSPFSNNNNFDPPSISQLHNNSNTKPSTILSSTAKADQFIRNLDPSLEQMNQIDYFPSLSSWKSSTRPVLPFYKGSRQSSCAMSPSFTPKQSAPVEQKPSSNVDHQLPPTNSRSNFGLRKQSVISNISTPPSNHSSDEAVSARESASPKPSKKKAGRRRKPTAQESTARRDSLLERNRRAAEKCRLKKKDQEEHLREDYRSLAQRNRDLKEVYQELLQEVAGLKAVFQWEMDREWRASERWSGSSSASVDGASPIDGMVKQEDYGELTGIGRRRIDLDGMDLDVGGDLEA